MVTVQLKLLALVAVQQKLMEWIIHPENNQYFISSLLQNYIGGFVRIFMTCLLFQFPSSQEEWIDMLDGFSHLWEFEHCISAIDGKNIATIKPHSWVMLL